jgi:hypothetical protein
MKRRKGTKRTQTKRVVRGPSEEQPEVQRLSAEDLEKFNFFINLAASERMRPLSQTAIGRRLN